MRLRILRDIGTITTNQLQRLVIDPSTYIWLFTLPLLITYVLGISLNSLFAPEFKPVRPYQVGVVQQSEANGAPIVEQMESLTHLFTVTRFDDEASMQAALNDKQITAMVVIPADLTSHSVHIVTTPESIVSQVLYEVIRPVVDHVMVMSAAAAQPTAHVTKTQISTVALESEASAADAKAAWANTSSFQYYSLAIAVMFAMYAANVAMWYCAGDYSSGAYARMRTYGVSRPCYLFAGYLSAAAMAVLFISVMTLVTNIVLGVNWGAFSAWLLFTLICGLTSAALAFLILSVVPSNPKIVDGIGSLVFNFIAFLGGSTAPLAVLPQWLVSFTAWLPNRAILEGYLRLSHGANLASLSHELTVISMNLLVLLGLSLVINIVRPKGAL